jgi:Peptidase family M28
MRSKLLIGTALVGLVALSWLGGSLTRAQNQGQSTTQQSEAAQVNAFMAQQQQAERDFEDPQFFSPESAPRWPLVGPLQRYSSIKAEKLLGYIKEQVDFSYKSRDQGDQLWGRITGTQIDAEDAAWFMSTLRKIGVTDVHQEMLDLPPQATTKSWEATVSGNGKAIKLDSAVAVKQAPGTPNGSMQDLECAWVGLGTEADFAGRDVTGKAVFAYAVPLPGTWKNSALSNGVGPTAEAHGAAMVFLIVGIPGNQKEVFSAGTTKIPGFLIGNNDGRAVRELIEQSSSGGAPHVKVRSDIEMVAGEKTSLVWGVIPGMTDETVIINAHRDGYFEAADDNASGVATALGLAEYFVRLPKAQRHRTIVIVGNPGHHNTAVGIQWMVAHKDTFFAKTALLINAEHTGQYGADTYGYRLLPTNTPWNFDWYVGGGDALEPIVIRDWDQFGISRYLKPTSNGSGDLSALSHLAPSIDLIQASPFYHSDRDTLASISPWCIENVTRSYAKIIEDLESVSLQKLAWPVASGKGLPGEQ